MSNNATNNRLRKVSSQLHQAERRHLNQAPRGPANPVRDPYGSRSGQQHHIDRPTTIHYGRIIDTLPGIHWFKVHPDKGDVPISCCALVHGNVGPLGARQSSPYSPGQRIYFIKHPHTYYGEIIGSVPDPAMDATRALNDQVSMTSNCGVQVDRIHQTPFSLNKNHGITDWSSNRPSDTLTGDYTWMADTGLGLHVDPFMVAIKADENTGIWGFYKNQHLRVAGHNYQQWSAGKEVEVFDDQGELSWHEGETPYSWEYVGTDRVTPPYQEIGAEDYQLKRTWLASREPMEEDQEPIFRFDRFGGYLGQGQVQFVSAPGQATGINTLSAPVTRQALFQDQLLFDGTRAMRSARRVLIQKSPNITRPTRVKRPNDLRGDTSSNYDFAGHTGTHKVQGDLDIPTGSTPARSRIAYLQEQHSYLWNWRCAHPFYYHNKDFEIPEEAELGRSVETPSFGSLSGQQDLPDPSTTDVFIDHRYGNVPVYNSSSFIDLTEDGSIVLGDGFGSTIVLSGGHIYFNCPGDIFLGPGRNLIGWAGKNMSFRSNKEAEFSVTEGSMRVKAEKHMMLLSGNGGQGSMLIENRGKGTADFDSSNQTGDEWGQSLNGIQVKTSSEMDLWSQSMYLRTGGGDIQEGGGITIDANKGKSFIQTNSDSFDRFIESAATDYFGEDGSIDNINTYGKEIATIDSKLSVTGIMSSDDMIITKTNFFAAGGHIFTSQAKNFEFLVGELKDESLQQTKDYLQELKDYRDDELSTQAQETYQAIDEDFYQDGKAGNDESIKSTGFSFRKTSEYGTDNFILFDSRWQIMARFNGDGQPWTEKAVKQGDQETYPFPGKEALVDNQSLRTIQATLYTPSNGLAKNRSSGLFESPVMPAPQNRNLQGTYLITG